MILFIKKSRWLLKTFRNPISIFLFYRGVLSCCTLKFRDSKINDVYITKDYFFVLYHLLSFWESNEFFPDKTVNFLNNFDINNDFFEYDGLICKAHPSSWIFIESDEYFDKFLIKNRTVIDIGGNVGDTALKFAKHGALVYAFEPMPNLYKIAIENINFNNEYKDKIQFYNKAISHKRGELTIFKDDDNTGGHSQFRKNGEKYVIEAITIEDAIKKYNIRPDILKMDCEGCEYNIILNSDLTMFNDIIFEFHAFLTKKPYTILINKLKDQGFNVRTYINSPEQGMIHAYK